MSLFQVDKCPYCGCTELGSGKQNSYANITVDGHLFKSSEVSHIICTRCGSIVHSYVEHPERFQK